MKRIAAIIAVGLLLGCGRELPVLTDLSKLDTGITKPCKLKPAFPAGAEKRGLSESESASIIGRYEVIYDDCSGRHDKAIEIIEKRDLRLDEGRR